jgi:carbonic anhydrase/acetyltransferase-like protein (isoleucine patch superfamily)
MSSNREPLIVAVADRRPSIDATAWIAPTASIVGAVSLGPGASVWYGAVLRADDDEIVVGRDSNIQDGAVLHPDPGYACHVGEGVTIGHGAIVHGARVGSGSLVGMGARLLNGANVGERCLVAAGALVPEGFTAPDGSLVVGVPAKVRRQLDPDEIRDLAVNAEEYAANARRHARAVTAAGRESEHRATPRPDSDGAA